MLVMRVLGDCPGCRGQGKFGNVSVRGDHVLRGCLACRYRERIPLPAIRKKILYLDQFFFSNTFKTADTRFADAADRIRRAADAQLLAAPFSSIHEDETNQWRGYAGKSKDDLMKFIKASSRGHEFRPAYDVEHTQIFRSFKAFVDHGAPQFETEETDAIESDLHKWDDYLWIDVGRYLGDIELMRTLKNESVSNLVSLFPAWRTSTNSFEQDVSLENRAAATSYMQAYQTYVQRMARGDYDAMFDSPLISMVVQGMLHMLPDDMEIRERFQLVANYFAADHFANTPYAWISSRMFAVLKSLVKNGAYPNPDRAAEKLSGFIHDVKHVSTYAPYCDAFVLDQAMAALVSDRRIALEDTFNVKIFSLNNWPDFLSWLDDLIAGTTDEHREALAAAYPGEE